MLVQGITKVFIEKLSFGYTLAIEQSFFERLKQTKTIKGKKP